MARKKTKSKAVRATKAASPKTQIAGISHRRLSRLISADILRRGIGTLGAEYTEHYSEQYSEVYTERYTEQYTDSSKIIRPGVLRR